MLLHEQPVRKVLMTADTIGGVWTYALDLCRAFQFSNVGVCLATMGAPLSEAQRLEASAILNLELRESAFKLEWMHDPWEDVALAGKWLIELEQEIRPDLVHLNGYSHANLPWRSPVVVVAHSCVLSWWQAIKKAQPSSEWIEYSRHVSDGLKAADAIIAVSHTYAGILKDLYGPLPNIEVIYNGLNADEFYTGDKKKQAFAMGRIWDEAKNLTIFNQLENESQIPFLIAGDNNHPLINMPPVVISNVQFLGKLPQSEIKRRLAESFIYVLPAKYEPFGLSVLEAALSGCLLLLADIPTLKELWQDTALYFNPDKPEELDYHLKEAVRFPEESQRLIQLSSARAKRFSLKATAKSYLELYRSLIKKQTETQFSIQVRHGLDRIPGLNTKY